jgi:hypothetical protein
MTEQTKKKTKLTLNTAGLILLVIIGVAYYYLWQARAGTAEQIADLSGNLTVVQMQSRLIKAPADGLQAQLTTLQAELAAAQSGFPNTLDRNEILDYLLDVASDNHVSILPVASDGWKSVVIGQPYRVLTIQALAQGSLKNVETFMTGIQTGRYPTLVITG